MICVFIWAKIKRCILPNKNFSSFLTFLLSPLWLQKESIDSGVVTIFGGTREFVLCLSPYYQPSLSRSPYAPFPLYLHNVSLVGEPHKYTNAEIWSIFQVTGTLASSISYKSPLWFMYSMYSKSTPSGVPSSQSFLRWNSFHPIWSSFFSNGF